MERKWYHFFVAIKRAYVLLYVFLFVVSLWSTNYSGRFQRYSIGKMSSDLFVKKWYEMSANDSSLNHYICGDKRVTLLSKPSLDNYASNATKKKVYSFSVYLKDEHCIANFNCFIGSTPLRWVLIIMFFELLIPPEPFMRDAPHFFYRKYNKNLL